MGATDSVDAFVEEQVLPEFRDIVAMVRAVMRECAPRATERISYGLPMWIGNSRLAWISPSKRDITFGFTCYGHVWVVMGAWDTAVLLGDRVSRK